MFRTLSAAIPPGASAMPSCAFSITGLSFRRLRFIGRPGGSVKRWMGRDLRAHLPSWNIGSSFSPPAAAAAGIARFRRWPFCAHNHSVRNFSSMANVEAPQKVGAKFFRGRKGAFTCGPTTGSKRMARRSLSKKATFRPETLPWIKPLPGLTTSSVAIIMPKRMFPHLIFSVNRPPEKA